MRRLIPLIVLTLYVFMSLTGCEQVARQPILEIAMPPQDSSEMDSLQKARAALDRVNERRVETYQKVEETGDFDTVFAASEAIFKEELGFRKGFWVDLVEIYRQENLENTARLEALDTLEGAFTEKVQDGTLGRFYLSYVSAFDALILEYLRLSFEFPEQSEAELLTLFRESVTDREITVVFP